MQPIEAYDTAVQAHRRLSQKAEPDSGISPTFWGCFGEFYIKAAPYPMHVDWDSAGIEAPGRKPIARPGYFFLTGFMKSTKGTEPSATKADIL